MNGQPKSILKYLNAINVSTPSDSNGQVTRKILKEAGIMRVVQ